MFLFSRYKINFLKSLFIGILYLVTMPGFFQAKANATEIRVEGSARIEPETIRSYVTIKPGESITSRKMDESLKKLFSTGFFKDVVVKKIGNGVVVRVVENPIINRIAFEGNKRISNETLGDEVNLRSRVIFTRAKVERDVKRLIDVYRQNGRFAASIVPKVIKLPQNRVDLIFEIKEGHLTKVHSISFVGNRNFSDRELRNVLQTKESAWYRFLDPQDTYDPDKLAFDRELLRKFYLNKGFADFRVISAVAELIPNRSGFIITFTIEEGKRYRFRKIDVKAAFRDLSIKELKSSIKIQKDDWYSVKQIDKTVSNLTDLVGTLGYAFVDIRPKIIPDYKNQLINLTFEINKGRRIFIERIEIIGNIRTLDSVIRREIPIAEGDAFNVSKIRYSKQKIFDLGFFETVNIKHTVGSSPDKVLIKVKVSEKSTGQLSFGIGASSEGPMGDISIRERNFLGKGQDLFLSTKLGSQTTQMDFSFTEPYFLDRKISTGIDIFKTSRDLQSTSSFERKSFGGKLRIGYELSERIRQRLQYGVSAEKVTNVHSSASLAVKEQEGSSFKSEFSQSLLYDTRDSRINPTKGFYTNYSVDLAGLGGSVKYLRNKLKAIQYFTFTDDLIGSLSGNFGYIFGLEDKIRIVDRFFLGGRNMRGFESHGVGPRDTATSDAIGGNLILTVKSELKFPLGFPKELGLMGRLFSDVGSLSESDSESGTVSDEFSPRVSIGFGLTWKTVLGPLSMDFSQAVIKEKFDKIQFFRFDFGARF